MLQEGGHQGIRQAAPSRVVRVGAADLGRQGHGDIGADRGAVRDGSESDGVRVPVVPVRQHLQCEQRVIGPERRQRVARVGVGSLPPGEHLHGRCAAPPSCRRPGSRRPAAARRDPPAGPVPGDPMLVADGQHRGGAANRAASRTPPTDRSPPPIRRWPTPPPQRCRRRQGPRDAAASASFGDASVPERCRRVGDNRRQQAVPLPHPDVPRRAAQRSPAQLCRPPAGTRAVGDPVQRETAAGLLHHLREQQLPQPVRDVRTVLAVRCPADGHRLRDRRPVQQRRDHPAGMRHRHHTVPRRRSDTRCPQVDLATSQAAVHRQPRQARRRRPPLASGRRR